MYRLLKLCDILYGKLQHHLAGLPYSNMIPNQKILNSIRPKLILSLVCHRNRYHSLVQTLQFLLVRTIFRKRRRIFHFVLIQHFAEPQA
jgi:hypothetical protein